MALSISDAVNRIDIAGHCAPFTRLGSRPAV